MEENNVKASEKSKNLIVRYVHQKIKEISKENVVGVYANLKKELIPNEEGQYEQKFVIRTTIVNNGPITGELPEKKEFFGNRKKGENSILLDFVTTSLQDYIDYSMCADVYTGSILMDEYGTLQAIKEEFSKDLSETDKQTLSREKVCFKGKSN